MLCALLGYKKRKSDEQRNLAAYVQELGGTADTADLPLGLGTFIRKVDISRGVLIPERRRRGWSLFRSPVVYGAPAVGDSELSRLAACSRLRELYLCGTLLTDTGMQAFVDLQALEAIDLSGTAITNDGLKVLAALQNLVAVDLSGTAVNDVGASWLGQMKRLRILKLNSCNISDASVPAICGLQELDVLEVVDCALSEEATLRIRRALPRTQVEFDRTRYIKKHGSF